MEPQTYASQPSAGGPAGYGSRWAAERRPGRTPGGAARANVLVAEARAHALGAQRDHAGQLALSWEGFEAEFRRLWPARVDTFFDDAQLERFLTRVWTESVGFAGTEIIRRVIGFAHLTDLTTLPDPLQVTASRRALLLGRELVFRRAELTDPAALRALVAGLTPPVPADHRQASA